MNMYNKASTYVNQKLKIAAKIFNSSKGQIHKKTRNLVQSQTDI